MARAQFTGVTWNRDINLGGSGDERISLRDALRQEHTAQEILRRLENQPGVILADEVGLGKTFVALAVAASVAMSTKRRHPIVVMVPPALTAKWPQEWHTFAEHCLPSGHGLRATPETIRKPSDFLHLFDDSPQRRRDIAFVAHGALTRQVRDPFTRLAIIRAAFYKTSTLASARESFPRWATSLLDSTFDEGTTRLLLNAPLDQWLEIWNDSKPNHQRDDDPVYLKLHDLIRQSGADLTPLRQELRGLPLKSSPTLKHRLSAAKPQLMAEVQAIWDQAIGQSDISSPLLILDEAHHVRNDGRVAGLLTSLEAEEDARALGSKGALAGKFERMLFLTATPFQLGHRELIRVVRRFDGVRWPSAGARHDFARKVDDLATCLDRFQSSAHRLETLWSRLETADVEGLPDDWWSADNQPASQVTSSSRLHLVRSAIANLQSECAEAQIFLRPWVIRHVRNDRGDRRVIRTGDAIRLDGDNQQGLSISPDALLPFLVAARARTIIADRRLTSSTARAFFAEGLASSFEAYRDTRRNREGFIDGFEGTSDAPNADLDWYLSWIERSLPVEPGTGKPIHPKVAATVERTIDTWARGEKVLVFCFYIETGRALRREISLAMEHRILTAAAEYLKLPPDDTASVTLRLSQIADNVLDAGSKPRQELEAQLREMCRRAGLDEQEAQGFIAVTIRFLRTESFLVRYLLPNGVGRSDLHKAMDHPDSTGQTLRQRLERFLHRLGLLSSTHRESVLEALRALETGRSATLDAAEGKQTTTMVLPNVRLANGQVRRETRETLIATFNMPFLPEVLIASPVLGEGVDLHWECRTVIHHDLDWNPSSLEQRNGRLDRLGSRSQIIGKPIEIYEPYTTGLQDEKMFRVVSDRGRWFNIVMGDEVNLTEDATEQIATRLPLPAKLAASLTLDLSVLGD